MTALGNAAKLRYLRIEKRSKIVAKRFMQCYSKELKLDRVSRNVQLIENKFVVIEDTITGENINELFYFQYGHPGAALWIHSRDIEINEKHLQSLRGSRGQLTHVKDTFSGNIIGNHSIIFCIE